MAKNPSPDMVAALQESEGRYRSVIAAMSEGIVLQDAEGQITHCNESAERILGLTADQMSGRTSLDPAWRAVHPDGSAFPGETHPSMVTLRTGRPCREVVMGVHRPDGSLVWISINSQPLFRSGETTPYAVVTSLTDITEHRREEEARSRSEQELLSRTAYLNELFHSVPEAIVLLDREDRVLRVNPEFTALFGYITEETIGRQINDLVVPSERQSEAEDYTVQLARGQRLNVETVRCRKDGTPVNVSILGVPVRVAGGQVALYAIYRDITARKQLEAQLLQALKMESVGRLAGGVAHDFNNLLTAILGYASLVEEATPPGDPQRENLGEIRLAANRAADLTRQLLAFARRQVIEPKLTDLARLIRNMEKILHRLIGEHVELHTEYPPEGLWPVRVDQGQFEQVVVNLAVNGRDAMDGGGQLTIRASNLSMASTLPGEESKVPRGDYVLVTVGDTGQGMSPETLAHIFEPFFTTKAVGKGTGLGLATCYGIIKQSRGYIFASSQPGQGSTFRIFLPGRRAPKKCWSRPEPRRGCSRGARKPCWSSRMRPRCARSCSRR